MGPARRLVGVVGVAEVKRVSWLKGYITLLGELAGYTGGGVDAQQSMLRRCRNEAWVSILGVVRALPGMISGFT